jgi:hypothetical protein
MSVVLRKPPDGDLWRAAHAGEDIHEMDGVAFEDLISVALRRYGYDVEMTERYDKGADIVATRDGRRTSIQVKRSSWSVSEAAVDQAIRGKAAYGCAGAMVISNSVFTPGARRLAERRGVVLWDHEDLANLLHATGIAPRTSASAPQCSTCDATMDYAWRPRPSWRCAGCRAVLPYRRWVLQVTAPSCEDVAPLPSRAPPPPPPPRLPAAATRRDWFVELKHRVALAALAFGWMCVVAAGVVMLRFQSPTQSTQRLAVVFVVALVVIPSIAGIRSVRRARRYLRGVHRTHPATR